MKRLFFITITCVLLFIANHALSTINISNQEIDFEKFAQNIVHTIEEEYIEELKSQDSSIILKNIKENLSSFVQATFLQHEPQIDNHQQEYLIELEQFQNQLEANLEEYESEKIIQLEQEINEDVERMLSTLLNQEPK